MLHTPLKSDFHLYTLSPHDFRFNGITDEGAFLAASNKLPTERQGSARFVFEARKIIDRIDPSICDFLANFNIAASPQNTKSLSPAALKKLDGTPTEFLMALVQYIDFSNASSDVQERNIHTLAGFVAQRFLAISLVSHGKKLNGETSSFHPERHEKVLSARSNDIAHLYNDINLSREMFGAFMKSGCVIQENYMNDRSPENDPIASKLRQFGVTPIIR